MALSVSSTSPGTYSTGDMPTTGPSAATGLDTTNALGDQSGGSSLLSSPLIQKVLQLFQSLINDMLTQASGGQLGQQQQPPVGSGVTPGATGCSGQPGATGGTPDTSGTPDAGGAGGTGGTNGGYGTTPATNPLVRLGADSAGANDDGDVSKSEKAAYQTYHDDMDHADKLAKQIAADPTQATDANLQMMTDLNSKILQEAPNVSVDAMRANRTDAKKLMDNYETDVDAATKAVDPNSIAGATLGINDAAASYATNSKYGTWSAANQKDGVKVPSDDTSTSSS